MPKNNQMAYFGGGCFWCTEAVFSELRGAMSVMPGYAGGKMPNPTYKRVCDGDTGDAEIIKIEFDPEQITYQDLLEVFFATHDPTTPNRQGNDIGTQYRSIILYDSEEQKKQAENFIKGLAEKQIYSKSIVTEIKPLKNFYEAETYHRQYFKNNPNQAYCQAVINPKLKKLREKYTQLLKS